MSCPNAKYVDYLTMEATEGAQYDDVVASLLPSLVWTPVRFPVG